MKISLITVCYNSEKTIEQTIESVKEQTYKDIEYIIVDGKSKDSTLDIINKYPDTVTKIISESDKGLYDAMNKGIRLATGRVIAFINSDDLFCDNNAIKKVMDIFIQNEHLDSIYADINYVDTISIRKIVRKWRSGSQNKFSSGWHPAHPTFYVKKDVYEKYGGFDLSFKLAADFEIMLRFLEKYKISTLYIPETFVNMRLGGETNKSFKNIFNQNIECFRAFDKNNIKVNKVLYPFKRLIPKIKQYF